MLEAITQNLMDYMVLMENIMVSVGFYWLWVLCGMYLVVENLLY